MYAFTKILALAAIVSSLIVSWSAEAGPPEVRDDGVTVIHLDEYNGYFAAEETVAPLYAGEYEFIVTNKADKLVGFQMQSLADTGNNIAMFPLEPGETRTARVTVTTDGVRFRCPINPTPWYDLDNIKVPE